MQRTAEPGTGRPENWVSDQPSASLCMIVALHLQSPGSRVQSAECRVQSAGIYSAVCSPQHAHFAVRHVARCDCDCGTCDGACTVQCVCIV